MVTMMCVEQVQGSLLTVHLRSPSLRESGPQVAASTAHLLLILVPLLTSSWAHGTAQALLVLPATSTTVFLTSLR